MKSILIVLILALTLIFIIQNSESVTVNFLNMSATMPMAFIIIITLLLGFLIGILLPSLKKDPSKK